MTDVLANVNRLKNELAQLQSLDEVKKIRDKAEALRVYVKKAHHGRDMTNHCAELKIRAERRAGEMLCKLALRGGDRRSKSHDGTLKLSDLEISRSESSRWQQIAAVPGRDFEKHIAEVKARNDSDLTSIELQRMGKRVIREREKEQRLNAAARPKKTESTGEVGKWTIMQGDCVDLLRAHTAKAARLIFADPPYNIGVNYGDGKEADQMPYAEYLSWCASWIDECKRVLTDDGSLWVMICDEWADHLGMILRVAGLHRRAWIKWYETFGVNQRNNFNRCSRHIFYCVNDPKRFVFHADAVNRPSDRQTKYKDKRTAGGGKIWDDVWQIPRLTGTAKERIAGFPTQVPLAIMRAIVCCASDPGDLVIDPFSGSASTGHAAVEAGREYIGFEKQANYVEKSRKRLAGV